MRPSEWKQMGKLGGVSSFMVISCFCLFFVGGTWAEDTSKLIQELRSNDPAVRTEAALKLGELKDPSAIDPLITTIKGDKDWGVRSAAEDALVNIGPAATEPLITLLKDNDWHVRRRALWTLGRIRDPRAIEALAVAMKNDKDCGARRFSAEALGETNDARAAEILLDALKNNDLEVVTAAYRFYIRLGEPGSEPILIEALNNSWNRTMARDFLSSGNGKLEKAASAWAETRARSGLAHYTAALTIDPAGPKWGTNK